jgi:hypothetical protein
MKYQKPNIMKLAEAASAIQGGKGPALTDSPSGQILQTVPAYEADE